MIFKQFDKSSYRLWHWEAWPWLIKYIPITPVWLWYCIKARSLWFFTASNPTLTFGGYDGEGKSEMYEQLPKGSFPRTLYVETSTSFSLLIDLLHSKGLTFPLAVKPDIGRMGLMFRKIDSLIDLQQYHERMKVDYLLQEYLNYPLEVSVFYYRFPGQLKGAITGFVRKEHLSVSGDGKSTLLELTLNYPRAQFMMDEIKLKHATSLNKILPKNEVYVLSHALNLSRGAKLVSLEHEKDENLLKVFDDISYSSNFYFGRYDVKCASIDDLKQGKNFTIIEFNGSGAEPHHVYGNNNSLIQALKILVHHWRILFEISSINSQKGVNVWSFKKGYNYLKFTRQHLTLLRRLESETPTVNSILASSASSTEDPARIFGVRIPSSYLYNQTNEN